MDRDGINDDTRVDAPAAGRSDAAAALDDATTTRASEGDDSATQREPPLSTRATTVAVTPTGTRPSVTSTSDAMDLGDLERTRSFLRIAWPVCLAVAAPVPWLGGHPIAQRVFGFAMLFAAAVIVGLLVQLRDPKNYTLGRLLVVGSVLVAGAYAGIIYCGVLSPAVAAIPFGLYFFGLSQSFRATLAIFSACAVIYLVAALTFSFGLVPDPGLISAAEVPLFSRLALVAFAEGIFFATYLLARLSRRATQEAIELHERAVRELAGREALLHEARLDLERVLRARGLGRFSDEIVGSYRLGTILGRGGMGEVYDAVHIDSEEPAAVKLLHAQVLTEPDNVQRFMRECRLTASLNAPNVVRVLETSQPGAPIPYIAMERLHGEDLSDHLRARGRMELAEVVAFARDVGRGLDAAAQAGVVHRDVKPRNVFRVELGNGQTVWKILDFGVSKLMTDDTMTKGGMIGTPSYMAPEQASGGAVSHKSDLFALGLITYRAVTGRPAFSGDAVAHVLYQVISKMPPRPSGVAKLPRDVDAVLAIALAKEPDDRFDSAGDFAKALDAATRKRLAGDIRKRAERILRRTPWTE